MRYPRLYDREAPLPTNIEEVMAEGRMRGMVIREGGSTAGSCRARRLEALLSADACKLFFLTPGDLKQVPFEEVFAGPYSRSGNKVYHLDDLRAFAFRKHGQVGFQKKIDQRLKREANKKEREEAANAAAASLASNPPCFGNENAPPARVAEVSQAQIDRLRSTARQLVVGRLLTWDYLRSKNAPNGTLGSVQVEGVSQDEFAVLAGRANDPGLTTLVKAGAWYTVHGLSSQAVFGEGNLRGKGGRYGCNSDLGVFGDVELKYAPKMQRLTIKAEIRHMG